MTTLSQIRTGALIAASAAALIMAGSVNADTAKPAEAAKVHCTGVNSCKGTSDCKTAENACKGMNVCKGHGFLSMNAKDCTDKGGKIAAM